MHELMSILRALTLRALQRAILSLLAACPFGGFYFADRGLLSAAIPKLIYCAQAVALVAYALSLGWCVRSTRLGAIGFLTAITIVHGVGITALMPLLTLNGHLMLTDARVLTRQVWGLGLQMYLWPLFWGVYWFELRRNESPWITPEKKAK